VSERSLWETVRRNLGPLGDLERVENRVGVGTLDVSYCFAGAEGTLELKYLHAWPRRQETPIVIPHLTLDQVTRQAKRAAAGGRVFTLLRVKGACYALLDADATRRLYQRRLTRTTLPVVAIVYAEGAFPTNEIILALRSRPSLPGTRTWI
jgi:hypothetical protein